MPATPTLNILDTLLHSVSAVIQTSSATGISDVPTHATAIRRSFKTGLGWETLPAIKPELPLVDPRKAHLERPGAQTHLSVGYLGDDLGSNNNAPMALVDTALSGMGGRLFSKLRDKQVR